MVLTDLSILGVSFACNSLGGLLIASLFNESQHRCIMSTTISCLSEHYQLCWDDASMIHFSESLFSYKAVHDDLIHMFQDYDNGSFFIVDNYLWDATKTSLVYARIYLVVVELCSLVLG